MCKNKTYLVGWVLSIAVIGLTTLIRLDSGSEIQSFSTGVTSTPEAATSKSYQIVTKNGDIKRPESVVTLSKEHDIDKLEEEFFLLLDKQDNTYSTSKAFSLRLSDSDELALDINKLKRAIIESDFNLLKETVQNLLGTQYENIALESALGRVYLSGLNFVLFERLSVQGVSSKI